MGNQRQRKERLRRLKRQEPRRHGLRSAARRPTPVEAMVQKHEEQAAMFAKREDRFSQLLSKLLRDERRGEYVVTSSGLTEAEHEELERLAPEAHERARAELEVALEALRLELARWDPLHAVAAVQFSRGWAPWGTYYEPTEKGGEHYAELVGGLLATELPTAERAEVTYERVEALFDELEHIMEVLLLVNLSRRPQGDQGEAALRFLGAMRWMVLRGDSYGNHGIELARSLYQPHADWWVKEYGFSFDDLMRVAEAAVKVVHGRVNALMQESATAGQALVLEYVRAYASAGRPSTDELSNLEAAATFGIFIDGVGSAMSLTPAELSAASPDVPEEIAAHVLKEFSIAAGSLPPSTYSGLFDANPLRERPFLAADGRYVFVSPAMLLRDAVDVVERRLLAGQRGYPVSRARTLDRLAVDYLGRMLPGARCFAHLYYEDAELDGLVLFDDVAVVVEGKGSPLSVQALRGDTLRLARDIRDAVEDAWRQGARARSFILGDSDAVFLDANGNEVVTVPTGSINDVYIVNPTLHELGGHAPQLPRLRGLGLFPQEEFPWSVFINDLRVIAETCENAAVFLHYLVWRSRLPLGERVMVADELDLWGSYLLAERFGMLAGGGEVSIANSTTDFDAYYDGLMGRGPRRPPPRKFIEEPFRSFVDRMAQDRPRGWRDATGACLDLSIAELAVACNLAPEVAREADASAAVVWRQVGRVALVAVPRGLDVASAADVVSDMEDPTLVFYVTLAPKSRRRAVVVWAEYAKAVSFELSDFELWAQEQREAQMSAAPRGASL